MGRRCFSFFRGRRPAEQSKADLEGSIAYERIAHLAYFSVDSLTLVHAGRVLARKTGAGEARRSRLRWCFGLALILMIAAIALNRATFGPVGLGPSNPTGVPGLEGALLVAGAVALALLAITWVGSVSPCVPARQARVRVPVTMTAQGRHAPTQGM